MNINYTHQIGRLTRDPESKKLTSGTTVTSFSIANNETWYDKNTQEKKEKTEFHNIVVFGKPAESAAQHLKKGQEVSIQGKIQNRSFPAQDGTKKYISEIVAEKVEFGSKVGENKGYSGADVAKAYGGNQSPTQRDMQTAGLEYPSQDEINEIPF
jgi:single-strand DNA-binding protein